MLVIQKDRYNWCAVYIQMSGMSEILILTNLFQKTFFHNMFYRSVKKKKKKKNPTFFPLTVTVTLNAVAVQVTSSPRLVL